MALLVPPPHASFWREHIHVPIFPAIQQVIGKVFHLSPWLLALQSWSWWNTLVTKVSGGFLELSLRPRKSIFCCIRRFLLPHGCRSLRMSAVTFDRCQSGQDGVHTVKLSLHFAFHHPIWLEKDSQDTRSPHSPACPSLRPQSENLRAGRGSGWGCAHSPPAPHGPGTVSSTVVPLPAGNTESTAPLLTSIHHLLSP